MVRRLVISFKELGARCAAKDTLVVCRAICWFEATEELHPIARCRQLERFNLDEGLERYRDEELPRREQSWSGFWATAGFGTARVRVRVTVTVQG